MQHLPVNQNPVRGREYPNVPLKSDQLRYGTKHRGYQAFASFPQECGYDLTRLTRADYDKTELDDILAFLQDWLFFGLLIETLDNAGVCLNTRDFIESAASTRSITTARLPEYLFYWLAATESKRTWERIEHGRLVDACLALHCQVVNAFSEFYCQEYDLISMFADPQGLTFWGREQPPILLSLVVLGETIQYANHQINKIKHSRSEFYVWSFPYLDILLQVPGWCLATIETATVNCDISYKLYLCTFRRWDLRNHTRCTREKGCIADQVNDKTYRSKHSSECFMKNHDQGCEFIGPSMQEVATILEEGDIPLIALDTTVNPSTLEVVRYRKDSEFNNDYIAISHVWSYGLGNARENRLPRCQVERIQSLVNSMWEPPIYIIAFWIDTICVPLEKQTRTLALQSMDRVYAEARAVLVLDGLLQHSVNSSASAAELGVYLRHSPWMTRLWTYQEARLTQDLYLQFEDKSLHSDSLRREPHDFKQISDILISKDHEEILTHPNMCRLARALAYDDPTVRASIQRYASLPKQDDPAEEEARLSAIQLTEDDENKLAFLSIWRERMQAEFVQRLPQAIDKDLRVSMSLLKCNTVPTQANRGLDKLKGLWDGPIEMLRNFSNRPGYRAALQFNEICRGCQARSTSRPEDEALCLGVLLGLDILPIIQIPTLSRKVKSYLDYFRALNLGYFNNWSHSLVDRKLKTTHEKRMKVLLSQIDFFNKQIVFWDTPRLSGLGWQWCPASFMDKELDIERSIGGERCKLTNAGLIITNSAIKLSDLRRRRCNSNPFQDPSRFNKTLLVSSSAAAAAAHPKHNNDIFLHLNWHDQVSHPPSSRFDLTSWKSIRLKPRGSQPHFQQLWSSNFPRPRRGSGQEDKFSILVGQNDPVSETIGVLVMEIDDPRHHRRSRRYNDIATTATATAAPNANANADDDKNEDEVMYTQYLTVVENVTDNTTTTSTTSTTSDKAKAKAKAEAEEEEEYKAKDPNSSRNCCSCSCSGCSGCSYEANATLHHIQKWCIG